MIAALLSSLAPRGHCFAGNATWGPNPISGDWNTAANWTQNTVPNGAGDIATFGKSAVTDLSINTTSVEVSNIIFKRGADAYTITVDSSNGFLILNVTGTGVINKSGVIQTVICKEGTTLFTNGSAGESMSLIANGGEFVFNGSASAENATFAVKSVGSFPGHLTFSDTSTSAAATIHC